MRPLATRLARVIGLAVLLYSLVILSGHLGALEEPSPNAVAVDTRHRSGAVGLPGVVFLLSLDGPERWRSTGRRAAGWTGMMIAAVLPTSWLYLIAPVTLPVAGPHPSPASVDEQRRNLKSV